MRVNVRDFMPLRLLPVARPLAPMALRCFGWVVREGDGSSGVIALPGLERHGARASCVHVRSTEVSSWPAGDEAKRLVAGPVSFVLTFTKRGASATAVKYLPLDDASYAARRTIVLSTPSRSRPSHAVTHHAQGAAAAAAAAAAADADAGAGAAAAAPRDRDLQRPVQSQLRSTLDDSLSVRDLQAAALLFNRQRSRPGKAFFDDGIAADAVITAPVRANVTCVFVAEGREVCARGEILLGVKDLGIQWQATGHGKEVLTRANPRDEFEASDVQISVSSDGSCVVDSATVDLSGANYVRLVVRGVIRTDTCVEGDHHLFDFAGAQDIPGIPYLFIKVYPWSFPQHARFEGAALSYVQRDDQGKTVCIGLIRCVPRRNEFHH